MIVKVSNENLNILMNYVKQEPSINLFIIGDVEQFGLDVDFQDVFLQYENDTITACLLRYYTNIVFYSDKDNFDVSEIINLINSFEVKVINGKKSVIDRLLPYLENIKEENQCYFCELDGIDKLEKVTEDVKIATVNDLENIYQLLKLVDFHSNNFYEANKRKIESKAGRIYFIKNNEKIISSAATAIETSVSGMIGGVTTHFEHRNNGYASQIVSKLCLDLIKENKKPCLFYHNPKAGSIYHRLGFKDIDNWSMIKLE